MAGKKPAGGSSSSFTSDLFGCRETSSTSNEIFGSIFSSSFKGSEVGGKTRDFSNHTWYPKTEGNSKSNEWRSRITSSREASSFYQEQRAHPCHLSSSIYYGGQDFYSHPQSTQNPASGLNPSYNKDGGEDDSGGASRGNWWQGSLYY